MLDWGICTCNIRRVTFWVGLSFMDQHDLIKCQARPGVLGIQYLGCFLPGIRYFPPKIFRYRVFCITTILGICYQGFCIFQVYCHPRGKKWGILVSHYPPGQAWSVLKVILILVQCTISYSDSFRNWSGPKQFQKIIFCCIVNQSPKTVDS